MTIETWSAGLNGAGVYDTGTGFGGWLNYDAKPQGEGWSITGYRTVELPIHPKYGSSQKRQVPIYSRTKAPEKPVEQPTEQPKPVVNEPEPKLDTARIEAAKKAAEPYANSYAPPSLGTGLSYGPTSNEGSKLRVDPYASANQFGVDANRAFSDLIKGTEATARLQTAETGSALNYYLQRFKGAVPKLENWRSYYDPLKNDILKA